MLKKMRGSARARTRGSEAAQDTTLINAVQARARYVHEDEVASGEREVALILRRVVVQSARTLHGLFMLRRHSAAVGRRLGTITSPSSGGTILCRRSRAGTAAPLACCGRPIRAAPRTLFAHRAEQRRLGRANHRGPPCTQLECRPPLAGSTARSRCSRRWPAAHNGGRRGRAHVLRRLPRARGGQRAVQDIGVGSHGRRLQHEWCGLGLQVQTGEAHGGMEGTHVSLHHLLRILQTRTAGCGLPSHPTIQSQ